VLAVELGIGSCLLVLHVGVAIPGVALVTIPLFIKIGLPPVHGWLLVVLEVSCIL